MHRICSADDHDVSLAVRPQRSVLPKQRLDALDGDAHRGNALQPQQASHTKDVGVGETVGRHLAVIFPGSGAQIVPPRSGHPLAHIQCYGSQYQSAVCSLVGQSIPKSAHQMVRGPDIIVRDEQLVPVGHVRMTP